MTCFRSFFSSSTLSSGSIPTGLNSFLSIFDEGNFSLNSSPGEGSILFLIKDFIVNCGNLL